MIIQFSKILGVILSYIYNIFNNYGLAIIIFTLFSKIILFPINIFIQKNSIKMLKIKPKIDELKYKYADDKEKFMDAQIELFKQEKYRPSMGVIPLLIQIPIILALVKVIENTSEYLGDISNTLFLGVDLLKIPNITSDVLVPIAAAISCVMLCYFQNRANILQRAESLKSKLFTGGLTTVITIYFVFIVPNGVGLYWIIGNLLSIIQLYILNMMYPPERYVDYKEIKYWKKLNDEKAKEIKQNKAKEKVDYKRFMNKIENKKLIFYSEKSGFYKYFNGIIQYLLNNTDIKIHYITSDPNDKIFEKDEKNLKAYYIGKNKLIPLFMKLEADVVVMTTPDLQKFYLKRSIVKKDTKYIYMDHSVSSYNLTLRTGALDYYDYIFATGFNQVDELTELKKIRKMYLEEIVKVGFPLLDDLMEAYNKIEVKNKKKTILIAPSYQEDNILESCIEEMLDKLLELDYKIIVRPHPQFIQRHRNRIDELLEKYKDEFNDDFYFELDFSSNETIYTADLLITDWSSISYEYSFTTTKPTLFINTKMKVINKEYKKIDIVPIEIEIRNIIGKSIDKDEISNINEIADELIKNSTKYKNNNIKTREKYLYNLGNSGEIGAKFIMKKLKIKEKEDEVWN